MAKFGVNISFFLNPLSLLSVPFSSFILFIFIFLFLKILFDIGVQLINNVVLVSQLLSKAVQLYIRMYLCCSVTKLCLTLNFVYCSLAKLCLTLCDSINCITPCSPVLHYLLELVSIELVSYPTISSSAAPFPFAYSPYQHHGLFQ